VFHKVLDVTDMYRVRERNAVRLKMQTLQSKLINISVMLSFVRLKCHNKCTKEAPPCHLLIYHRGARQLVRTESVPCDINNPLRYSDLHISQTLPKTNKINKDHIPVPYQPDSSSNPSSTTSSTPSSPAPPLPPSATPPSPLHPSPQSARQQKPSNLTASHFYKYKQRFIFPDVAPEVPTRAPQVILHPVLSEPGTKVSPLLQIEVEPTSDFV
ncbi:hypothetical protein cypCar_00025088, partial [Cyprinus carpio]